MQNCRWILFDIDDTLLDFDAAYASAREKTAQLLGLRAPGLYEALDRLCMEQAWQACGLDRMGEREVQRSYHSRYMQYVHMHFAYLTRDLELEGDTQALVRCYLDSVSASGVPMEPDTLEVYRALSGRYRLVLAGNGLTKMQTARTSAFAPYTYRTFISEAVGEAKPSAAFFDHVLRTLGCRPEECLMVGDSMECDMRGAKAAGMRVCLYDPRGRHRTHAPWLDAAIGRIACLKTLLL